MTKERYIALRKWFSDRKSALYLLKYVSKGMTVLVYILYSILVLWTFAYSRGQLPRVLAVPALVFISGSLLRKKINAPRPYEIFEMAPLIHKDTRGKSFPSRHVFCAAVISMAWLYMFSWYGIAGLVLAVLIALSRVLTGVHWPKDVIAGLAFGWILGYIGFFII